MASVDEAEYLRKYQRIQSKKEILNQVIKDGNFLSEKGDHYAIHREIGVLENMINVFISSDKFEFFGETIVPDSADGHLPIAERNDSSDVNDKTLSMGFSEGNHSRIDENLPLAEKVMFSNNAYENDSPDTNSSDESCSDSMLLDTRSICSGETDDDDDGSIQDQNPVEQNECMDLESDGESDSTDPEHCCNLSIAEIRSKIENDDVTFAKRIRECCDDFGREIPRFLNETAGYLRGLGCWYMLKKFEDKMDQKLNLIRAATLINAAVERYQTTNYQDDYDETIETLKYVHRKILEQSVSVKKGEDFVDFCLTIKEKVENLREIENRRLSEVQRIRNHFEDDDMRGNPTLKNPTISMIKQISKSNTENYKKLMVEIIENCLIVMGSPPCQFVIAGLGSLAREEVTLSSDFEHVIILSDETPDTEEVREYFRWFTVIFHVIIIGLRETIIPSVDIKSLCDHYSTDPSEKWFKDFYTPCGISFDGMMPHACKCPLGRQRPTENYDNVVELIQTVSVMASYLTKEEQLKHGYMLHDVLGTTCYVYGSRKVYGCFLDKCEAIQNSMAAEEFFLHQRQLLKDLAVNWKSTYSAALQYIDVKKALYRPLTFLLHVLTTQFNLPSQSSFDIVDDLRFRGVIDDRGYHLLSQAVAIALEIRMRCYRTKHRQRNAISYKDLPKKVGRHSSAILRTVIQFFLHAVRDYAYRRFVLKKDYNTLTFPSPDGDIWKSETLRSSFHVCDDEGETIHRILDSIESILCGYKPNDQLNVAQSYFYLKLHFRSLCDAIHRLIVRLQTGDCSRDDYICPGIRKIYLWANQITIIFGVDLRTKLIFLTMKAYVLYLCGVDKYGEANEILDEAITLHTIVSKTTDYSWDRHVDLEILIKNAYLPPADALEYFDKALKRRNVNLYMKCIYKIGIAKALWLQGNKRKAEKKLEQIKFKVISFPRAFSRTDYRIILEILANSFGVFGSKRSMNDVYEVLYESADPNITGEYPGITDKVSKLNELIHYRYNFGVHYNVGKYSNFTFNMVEYEEPLYVNMAVTKQAHSLHIFSSVSYNDLIALIEYSLDGELRAYSQNMAHLKGMPNIWKQTKLIALMALAENVKSLDFILFRKLLENAPDEVLKIKLLQPFLYACFQEFSSSVSDTITRQNAIFQQIFQFSTEHKHLTKKALSSFMNFNYQDNVKLLWNSIHCKKSKDKDVIKMLEFFLTSILTIMIVRKRTSPLPHLKRSREISLMQSLWLKASCTDENRHDLVIGNAFLLSSFYCRESSQCAIVYNLAVNFVLYDERACSALLWKLIQSGRLERHLYKRSVMLLFEAMERICDGTLAFGYISRM